MNERANPFAQLNEPVNFSTKPRQQKPVEEAVIEDLAKQNNFPSRQAPKASSVPRRKVRRFRTGRNQQVNIKATAETIERFIKAADVKNVPLGEMLKQLLDTHDGAGGSR